MLKIGCSIISLWAVLNLLASLILVLIPVLGLGESAPALLESLSTATIKNIDPKVLSNANSIAVYANTLNIAASISILFIVWFGVYNKKKWSLAALFLILSLMLSAGFFSDYVSKHDHIFINIVSGTIIFIGLLFSILGIYKPK